MIRAAMDTLPLGFVILVVMLGGPLWSWLKAGRDGDVSDG